MNKNQAVAYVMDQSVAALAEIEAMRAENMFREHVGQSIAYTEDAFLIVLQKYDLNHNDVMRVYSEAIE